MDVHSRRHPRGFHAPLIGQRVTDTFLVAFRSRKAAGIRECAVVRGEERRYHGDSVPEGAGKREKRREKGERGMLRALELKVPPPIVAAAFAAGMYGVSVATPGAKIRVPGPDMLAALLAASGITVAAAGLAAFRRHHTTVNPHTPERASTLVCDGVYRMTRNPMYLGLTLMLAGWAVWLGNLLAMALVAGFVAWISRFQIVPEERVLRARFGDAYELYVARVRRWV